MLNSLTGLSVSLSILVLGQNIGTIDLKAQESDNQFIDTTLLDLKTINNEISKVNIINTKKAAQAATLGAIKAKNTSEKIVQAKQEAARLEAIRIQEEAAKVRISSTSTPKAIAKIPTPARVSGNFEDEIRARCAEYGCNPEQLIRIMYCESGGRSNAKNPSGASGLFQFMPRTFSANAARMGMSGASIWDPYAQIRVAAWMFANGQAWQWTCK